MTAVVVPFYLKEHTLIHVKPLSSLLRVTVLGPLYVSCPTTGVIGTTTGDRSVWLGKTPQLIIVNGSQGNLITTFFLLIRREYTTDLLVWEVFVCMCVFHWQTKEQQLRISSMKLE